MQLALEFPVVMGPLCVSLPTPLVAPAAELLAVPLGVLREPLPGFLPPDLLVLELLPGFDGIFAIATELGIAEIADGLEIPSAVFVAAPACRGALESFSGTSTAASSATIPTTAKRPNKLRMRPRVV